MKILAFIRIFIKLERDWKLACVCE